jgi:hypothetical protein
MTRMSIEPTAIIPKSIGKKRLPSDGAASIPASTRRCSCKRLRRRRDPSHLPTTAPKPSRVRTISAPIDYVLSRFLGVNPP